MLGLIPRKWWRRGASLLVALYVVCLIAPTAVLAFSTTSGSAPCLADDHHGLGTTHVHQDGSSHHHPGNDDEDRSHHGKCCGLFCLSAITPDVGFVTGPHPIIAQGATLLVTAISGRGFDRIDRPPRSDLSL
jgi:hypothetical protein